MRFYVRKCVGVGVTVLVGLWLPAMTGCTDADLSTFLADLGVSLDVNVTIDDNSNGNTNDNTNDNTNGDTNGGTDAGSGFTGGGGDEIRFAAPLSGGGSSSGSAVWRVRSDRVVFKVEVESGQPGAMLDIVVDGVVIDALTLDATGFGEVEYRDPPDNNPDPNEFPLPDIFPADVGDGSTVWVGDLSGVLAVE